jgi:hypothetical protein
VFNAKRAPTLALGLFLSLLFSRAPLLAAGEIFSLSAEAGSPWVEDGAAVLYWQSGLSVKKGERFYSDLAFGRIASSLPWAEGAVLGGRGKFGFGLPRFGLDFSYGFLQHGLFSAETEIFSVRNDGGRFFYAGLEAPVRFGDWSVVPSFVYGSGSWDKGDLYWFFGKPDIPALAVYGLSVKYRERTELALRHLFMDMDVLPNDGAGQLFDSRLDAYAAYGRFSREIAGLRLGGSLGWLYAEAGINGALTDSNQHFVYFPYNFYRMNGSLDLHAGFGAVDLKQDFSFFHYRLMIGVAHIVQGGGLADIHYKKKTLFGGEEVFDKRSLDLGGVGAAFMLFDAEFSPMRLGRREKTWLSLGLKKLFAVPWGYDKAASGASSSSGGSGAPTGGLLKTALLSGLSFYGSLRRR